MTTINDPSCRGLDCRGRVDEYCWDVKKPHSFDDNETPRQRYRRILDAGRETERTVFFSDAVMAIAMTLLVLEIKIPDAVHDPTSASDTADDVYALVAYVLAFILIAINWMAHHRTFRVIERFDRQLHGYALTMWWPLASERRVVVR